MNKILFALFVLITVSLSFCKKEACRIESSTPEAKTVTYTEMDSLSPFKGQNTLNFSYTTIFRVGVGDGSCGHGGCFANNFKVLNLTKKTVTIKVFGSAMEIPFNPPPKVILTCLPNELLAINDASITFVGCNSDLSKIIQVSYN